MASDEPSTRPEAPGAANPATHLFAVRLWTEEPAGGSEYRGSVRDVMTQAFRGFRDWSELVAFMVARMEHEPSARDRRADGDADVSD
jgi:hypothetical protein